MRLALAFGIPPRELLRRLTARELVEFEELYRMDPWGEERADLRAGIIASTLVNLKRDPKKTKAFRPVDFMPYVDREALEQADRDALAEKLVAHLKPTKKKPARRSR